MLYVYYSINICICLAKCLHMPKDYSVSHKRTMERQLACYPRPKFFAMFEADRVNKGLPDTHMRKAELLNDILEQFYRSKPEGEQQRLLKQFEMMSIKKAGK
jgi:hypothetical protein